MNDELNMLRETCRRQTVCLTIIARRTREELDQARTLHYDMAGWAQAGLDPETYERHRESLEATARMMGWDGDNPIVDRMCAEIRMLHDTLDLYIYESRRPDCDPAMRFRAQFPGHVIYFATREEAREAILGQGADDVANLMGPKGKSS